MGQPVLANYPLCSGHGVCKTMREASNEFDGISLVSPAVNYNNWDADKITGCVCDPGFSGVDCSLRQCPMGLDPALPSTSFAKIERYLLECRADAGYFTFQVLGRTSEPIPFDADPDTLRVSLQRTVRGISSVLSSYDVEDIRVAMRINENTGLATVCRDDTVAVTEITFSQVPGPRPPVKVQRTVAATRRWPRASERLSLLGSETGSVLRMSTEHRLYCPICTSESKCSGEVRFTFNSEVSTALNVTELGASSAIEGAVRSIQSLRRTGITSFGVNVTIYGDEDRICSTSSNTTTVISIYSDFGNIHPALSILSSGYVNVTMDDNTGNGTLRECSGQGYCDHTTGLCSCMQSFDINKQEYRYLAKSSDGRGNIGSRGDCGYLEPVSACVSSTVSCSGHGRCGNSTGCVCDDGFFGASCSLRLCPTGRSFFDEALYNDTAHRTAVCSNNGVCDNVLGLCKCRDGFVGDACDMRDCVRDAETGIACNGRGRCLSVRQQFALHGLQYGNISFAYADGLAGVSDTTIFPPSFSLRGIRNGRSTAAANGGNWDADIWQDCVCAAASPVNQAYNHGRGIVTDPAFVTTGPRKDISGISYGSRPLPGFTSYDCSQFRCPTGDAKQALYGYSTRKEVQRVTCSLATRRNDNNETLQTFTLKLLNTERVSLPIASNATAAEIEEAISYLPSIGNVSVYFPEAAYLDGIGSACSRFYNSSFGGFVVKFETEAGVSRMFCSDYVSVLLFFVIGIAVVATGGNGAIFRQYYSAATAGREQYR